MRCSWFLRTAERFDILRRVYVGQTWRNIIVLGPDVNGYPAIGVPAAGRTSRHHAFVGGDLWRPRPEHKQAIGFHGEMDLPADAIITATARDGVGETVMPCQPQALCIGMAPLPTSPIQSFPNGRPSRSGP